MRHLLSLLLGIVMAPVLWVLAGLGGTRYLEAYGDADPDDGLTRAALLGVALLLATGLVLGLLLASRLSPVGPAVAGLTFLAVGVLFLLERPRVLEAVSELSGANRDALVFPLVTGVSWLLGMALVVPLAFPSRWRGRPAPVPATEPEAAPSGDGAPSGPSAPGGAPYGPPQGGPPGALHGAPQGLPPSAPGGLSYGPPQGPPGAAPYGHPHHRPGPPPGAGPYGPPQDAATQRVGAPSGPSQDAARNRPAQAYPPMPPGMLNSRPGPNRYGPPPAAPAQPSYTTYGSPADEADEGADPAGGGDYGRAGAGDYAGADRDLPTAPQPPPPPPPGARENRSSRRSFWDDDPDRTGRL